MYTTLSVAGKKQRYIHQRHTSISLVSLLVNLLRAFIFPIQFRHAYFCCLFYSWRSPALFIAKIFIVLLYLQVSAAVRRFLPGWVGLKKKRRNDISRGNFGMDATPKCNTSMIFIKTVQISNIRVCEHLGITLSTGNKVETLK